LLKEKISLFNYRPDIDGLRAVAVLAVVAFHAFPSWVSGGFIGVDVFFVISGYLISINIFDNLEHNSFSFADFYARRIQRIFPALILILTACYAYGWIALVSDEYKQLGKHVAAGANFVSNYILWNEVGYFDNTVDTKPLIHLWSLSIEEQFYILWPLLLWFAWKHKFNIFTITVIITVISFILNIKGAKQDMTATFYSPQTRFWELLSGSLLAYIKMFNKPKIDKIEIKLDYWLNFIVYSDKQKNESKLFLNLISFLGLFLLLCGFWKMNKELSFPGYWAIIPVLGTLLIISAESKAYINNKILSNKFNVWFGLISFPLYLWHWPILSFARIYQGETPSLYIRVLAVFISTLLAWLTYKLVEAPIRFGRRRRINIAILVVLMVIVGVCGYYLYNNNGFKQGKSYISFSDQYKRFNNIFYKCENNLILNTSEIYDGNIRCWQSNTGKPNVILLGDSHAENLFYGLASLLKEKNIAAYIKGGRPSIDDINFNSIFNELLTEDGREKKILLITQYADDWNNGHLVVELQKTIELLKNKGYEVALIGDIPQFPNSPTLCKELNFKFIFRNLIGNCQINLNYFIDQKSVYDESLNQIAILNNIPYVSADSAFCNLNSCSMFDEDLNYLYIDNNHLNPEGSMRIANILVKELKDIGFF